MMSFFSKFSLVQISAILFSAKLRIHVAIRHVKTTWPLKMKKGKHDIESLVKS